MIVALPPTCGVCGRRITPLSDSASILRRAVSDGVETWARNYLPRTFVGISLSDLVTDIVAEIQKDKGDA
jgi:hypothetical protein